MKQLIAELTNYMNESWARGNRVISIDGVRAIIKRHQTHTMPRESVYPSTVEYLQERELQRTQRVSRGLKIH